MHKQLVEGLTTVLVEYLSFLCARNNLLEEGYRVVCRESIRSHPLCNTLCNTSHLFFIRRMPGVREAIDVSQPGEYAWYLGNSEDTTLAPYGERHPVGEKMPNPGKNEMSIE